MAGIKEEEEESKNKKQRFDEPCASLEKLPFDSVMEMEILPRLPLKSILRLESASKPLSPLISDHLRRRYSLPTAVSGLFFSSPISKTPTKNFYHALDSKFVIDGTLSTLPSTPDDNLVVVDCCNGLLLCRCEKINQGYQSVVLFVCNPLTGQCVSIPIPIPIPIPNSFFIYRDAVLAFDPRISGHYNLLRFCSGDIDVFSSETGSWVQKKQGASHRAKVDKGYPFFFNGKVYLPSYKRPFVKVFDRQGRLVGKINLPHSEKGFPRLLGHCGGHLHFAVMVFDKMPVWILEDYGESRWVLKHTINLRDISDDAGLPTLDLCWTYPQVFHPDMDEVFIQVKDKIFSYHLDNGDFAEVCTHPWMYKSVFAYSPCYSKDFDL